MKRHSARLRRNAFISVFAGASLAWTACLVAQRAQSLPSNLDRIAEMRHHYLDVTLAHEAMIRGDLPGVREPAMRLAALPTPPDMPASAVQHLVALTVAGQRAANAMTLASAATATVSMLRQCGDCHRDVGVRPSPSTSVSRDLGGLVGHMLEHRRALDQLLQGLIIPSSTSWQQGIDALRVAPLRPGALPADPKLTADVRAAELAIHDIASRANADDSPNGRANTYGELLTMCASCHSLHRRIWGPGTGR